MRVHDELIIIYKYDCILRVFGNSMNVRVIEIELDLMIGTAH